MTDSLPPLPPIPKAPPKPYGWIYFLVLCSVVGLSVAIWFYLNHYWTGPAFPGELTAAPSFAYEKAQDLEGQRDADPENTTPDPALNNILYRLQAADDLKNGNYGQIQKEFWGMLDLERFAGNDTYSKVIYKVLGTKENTDLIKNWINQDPTCHFAWTAMGEAYIDLAWSYRGNDTAANVPKEAWQPFRENLVKACQCFELSHQLDPNDPYASSLEITALMGLQVNRTLMEEKFKQALAAVPNCPSAYEAKARYLMPKWYGTWEEFESFCQTNADKASPGSKTRFLLLTDYYDQRARMKKETQGDYLKNSEEWPLIKNEYFAYLTTHFDDDIVRSQYAALARSVEDWNIVRQQFVLLKNRPGELWKEGKWSSEEDYNNTMNWALSPQAW